MVTVGSEKVSQFLPVLGIILRDLGCLPGSGVSAFLGRGLDLHDGDFQLIASQSTLHPVEQHGFTILPKAALHSLYYAEY